MLHLQYTSTSNFEFKIEQKFYYSTKSLTAIQFGIFSQTTVLEAKQEDC